MFKYFVAAVVAVIALQGCIARPADQSQLEVLANNAKNLADNITNTLGIKDVSAEKIQKTISDQAKVLSDNLNTIKGKIDVEIKAHEGDVKKNLKEFEDKLAKAAEDLRKIVDPEKKATKKAEEIRTQFDAGLKTTAAEFEKFIKTVQPGAQEAGDNFQKFAKSLLDSFLEVGQGIQTKVNKAVEDHQKTHKH